MSEIENGHPLLRNNINVIPSVLVTKASQSLEDQVQRELQIPDPVNAQSGHKEQEII